MLKLPYSILSQNAQNLEHFSSSKWITKKPKKDGPDSQNKYQSKAQGREKKVIVKRVTFWTVQFDESGF